MRLVNSYLEICAWAALHGKHVLHSLLTTSFTAGVCCLCTCGDYVRRHGYYILVAITLGSGVSWSSLVRFACGDPLFVPWLPIVCSKLLLCHIYVRPSCSIGSIHVFTSLMMSVAILASLACILLDLVLVHSSLRHWPSTLLTRCRFVVRSAASGPPEVRGTC